MKLNMELCAFDKQSLGGNGIIKQYCLWVQNERKKHKMTNKYRIVTATKCREKSIFCRIIKRYYNGRWNIVSIKLKTA